MHLPSRCNDVDINILSLPMMRQAIMYCYEPQRFLQRPPPPSPHLLSLPTFTFSTLLASQPLPHPQPLIVILSPLPPPPSLSFPHPRPPPLFRSSPTPSLLPLWGGDMYTAHAYAVRTQRRSMSTRSYAKRCGKVQMQCFKFTVLNETSS